MSIAPCFQTNATRIESCTKDGLFLLWKENRLRCQVAAVDVQSPLSVPSFDHRRKVFVDQGQRSSADGASFAKVSTSDRPARKCRWQTLRHLSITARV